MCQFLLSLSSSSCAIRSAGPEPPFLLFFDPPWSCSTSASVNSTCLPSSSTMLEMKLAVSTLSCSFGSSFCPALSPSFEKAFVFISFSQALKRSICWWNVGGWYEVHGHCYAVSMVAPRMSVLDIPLHLEQVLRGSRLRSSHPALASAHPSSDSPLQSTSGCLSGPSCP